MILTILKHVNDSDPYVIGYNDRGDVFIKKEFEDVWKPIEDMGKVDVNVIESEIGENGEIVITKMLVTGVALRVR